MEGRSPVSLSSENAPHKLHPARGGSTQRTRKGLSKKEGDESGAPEEPGRGQELCEMRQITKTFIWVKVQL